MGKRGTGTRESDVRELLGRRTATHVVLLGHPPELCRALREELEAQHWEVLTIDASVHHLPRLDDAQAVVIAMPKTADAVPQVERVVHAVFEIPILVVTEDDDPMVRMEAMRTGAHDCIIASVIRAAPVAWALRQSIVVQGLRDQLTALTSQLDRIQRTGIEARGAVSEAADALRATGSALLVSLGALRLGPNASPHSVEADMLDAMQASVRSMLQLIDSLSHLALVPDPAEPRKASGDD